MRVTAGSSPGCTSISSSTFIVVVLVKTGADAEALAFWPCGAANPCPKVGCLLEEAEAEEGAGMAATGGGLARRGEASGGSFGMERT